MAIIVRHHHERWDGKGYPSGICGEEIPIISRIISVADAFDAMTSNRSYRKPMAYEEALIQLAKGKWTQFDGEIVEIFLKKVIEKLDTVAY